MKALLSQLKKAEVTDLLCMFFLPCVLKMHFGVLIKMQLIECKREYFPL